MSLLQKRADAVPFPASSTTRTDYIDKVVAGGFPMVLAAATVGARSRWMDEYVRLTLERDVQDLSKVRQAHLLRVLPAWDRTLTKRTNSRPKLHVIDSGIGARLLRLNSEKLGRRDPTAMTEFGHALESFVIGELMKEVSWTDQIAGAGHWRTQDGLEVDLVVETDDGGVIAFEVKSAARVGNDDFRGMRKLRAVLGDAFLAGVALYTGERSYTYEERLHVMPVDRLWVSNS